MNVKKINKKVVLIADRINKFEKVDLSNDTLEFIEDEYYEGIFSSLKKICTDVISYDSPETFLKNITIHKDDIVFSIWSGRKSRNRRALVPSICEAYGILYVGADTYVNIVCQDKILSKQFATKKRLEIPNYVYFEGHEFDSMLIKNLRLPLVVKPTFEGGSIGISLDNLTNHYDSAYAKAKELFAIYKQPILIEEFIRGKEVSIVIMGNNSKIDFCEVVELYIEDNKFDLTNSIFSYEMKKEYLQVKLAHKLITAVVPKYIIDNAIRLFNDLGKVEVIRIDGRYDKENFYLLELSPDIHFGPGATFADAFQLKNITYDDMIYMVLNNSLTNQKVTP